MILFKKRITYDTFQKANNKGADQTARMRRTASTGWSAPVLFANHRSQVFSRLGPNDRPMHIVSREAPHGNRRSQIIQVSLCYFGTYCIDDIHAVLL